MVGSEQTANSTTNNHQFQSDGILLENGSNGDFMLFWSGKNQDGHLTGVIGQRFAADGSKIGSEFIVNQTTSGNQTFDEAIVLSDGSIVVIYTGSDSNGTGTYARHLDSSGTPIGNEVLVNTDEIGTQNQPDAAALEGGGFVVTWKSQATGDYAVQSQLFDNNLIKVGVEQTVYSNFPDLPQRPHVTATDDGGYVVVWKGLSLYQLGASDILGQRFDATGNKVGDTISIYDDIKAHQQGTDIATLPDGSLAVVWQENDSSGAGIWTKTLSFSESSGDDYIVGDNNANLIDAMAGDDYISGGLGDDTLIGGEGRDEIIGGFGNDTIILGPGQYDSAEGGSGADVFVFGMDDDRSWILDFEVGVDLIDLSGLNLSFADLTIQPLGTATLIQFGGTTQIELRDVDYTDITQNQFIF